MTTNRYTVEDVLAAQAELKERHEPSAVEIEHHMLAPGGTHEFDGLDGSHGFPYEHASMEEQEACPYCLP